jgi:hypothetical protein
MRTEDDIREALAAPSADESLRSLSALIAGLDEPVDERRSGRRRWAPVLAAAAVVTAVATSALIVVWGGGTDDVATGSGTRTPLDTVWHFAVDAVPGYEITRVSIGVGIGTEGGTEQFATITAQTSQVTGGLTLQSPEIPGYDRGGGSAVSITGQPGYFVAGTHVSQDNLISSVYVQPWRAADANNEHQPRLYWHYPDGSWAQLEGTFGFNPATYSYDNAAAKSIMLRIARAVRHDVHDAVRVPFGLGTAPAGLVLESVRLEHGTACLGYGQPTSLPGGGTVDDEALVCRLVTGTTRDETLRHARLDKSSGAVVTHDLPDGTSVLVTYPGGGSDEFTQDDANRVADDLDVSPVLSDPATWLPVG